MEADRSSPSVSHGSTLSSLSQEGSLGQEDQEGSSLSTETSEEFHSSRNSSTESHTQHPSGAVTPGKGDGISTVSLAGSLTALESAINRPSGDQMEEFQTEIQDLDIFGNNWDQTGDKYLLANGLLSEVDAQVAYALLDEYRQQLEVLGNIIAAPFIKDFDDEKETLRQRFQREEDEPLQIRSTRGDHIVPANPNLVKIQQDRAYLSKVIERLMKDLRRENSYAPLTGAVETEGTRRQEFAMIEEEAIANSQSIAELKKDIRHLKVSMAEEVKDREETILELKDELQEALARTGMEMRYTQASMQARLATSEGQLEARKVARRQEAERARVQCDYETRVNTEIESQLRDSLDELNEALDRRLTKFDVDTDAKERELNNIKYQKQQNYQALCEIRDKFAEYTRVISEDDEELRLEEERIQELERRERAAITIQAYWKGYLERKKLKKKMRKAKKAASKAKRKKK